MPGVVIEGKREARLEMVAPRVATLGWDLDNCVSVETSPTVSIIIEKREAQVILHVLALAGLSASVLAAQQVNREASISQFPQLPGDVAKDLNMRGCTVPQPPASRKLRNVIQGHFRDSTQLDWAVLCDSGTNGTSMLLVYWSGNPSQPVVVTKSKLQENSCWTEIAPVGKAFIMEHYQAYGGPKPPPIHHQGINIGVCDKGSTVSYFFRRQWLTLTGAD